MKGVMMINKIFVVVFAGLLLGQESMALEVDREVLPRITVGGRVIGTLDINDMDSVHDRENEINIRDSLLLLRFDKRLFEEGIAGGVIGFEENEDTVQFHKFYAFMWNRDYQLVLGRTLLPNTLINFPTPHDADLLRYTHVGNGSSNTEFDQLHARLLSFDWYVDRKVQRLNLWTGMRGREAGIPGHDGFDSRGVGYQYEQPAELRYVKRLRHAGVMVDAQKVTNGSRDEWMNAYIGGAEFNLNINPQANWSMAVQTILNEGIDSITAAELNDSVNAVANQARAKSTAIAAGWRYTSRPNLLTRWQASFSLGYKDYSDVSSASQWSVVPAYINRIGQGIDLLAELIHTQYDDALYNGGEDNIIQLGIAFSLDARFNDNIGERSSILNLEHGYIQ